MLFRSVSQSRYIWRKENEKIQNEYLKDTYEERVKAASYNNAGGVFERLRDYLFGQKGPSPQRGPGRGGAGRTGK